MVVPWLTLSDQTGRELRTSGEGQRSSQLQREPILGAVSQVDDIGDLTVSMTAGIGEINDVGDEDIQSRKNCQAYISCQIKEYNLLRTALHQTSS
jgi:hypothetical protein